MSIPFSNTHYRIPPGFANLLEGLTMEVLREQPQDIPHFAARYFAELLKKREESGFDPAEWGAALEDRYYNNHSFQHPEDKTFTARTEDIGYSTVDGPRRPQDLTSSVQEKETYQHKLVEDGPLPAHTEDGSDEKESAPVLDTSEDPLEPDHRPSSPQAHKEEKSDTDSLLQEQSATVIQAAFRGHQAREGVRRLKEESGDNDRLSSQENPTSEEAAPQDTDRGEENHSEDKEPHATEMSQEDATPGQPQDSDTVVPDDAATTQDGAPEEDLEMEQAQGLHDEEGEQKEDDQEVEDPNGQETHREEDKDNSTLITEEVNGQEKTQDHREEDMENSAPVTEEVDDQEKMQDHREEDMENSAPVTEEVDGQEKAQDHREEDMEDSAPVTEEVDGQDMTQDHREEDMEDSAPVIEEVDSQDMAQDHRENDNMATKDDGESHENHVNEEEKTMMVSEGLEGTSPPSAEGPDTSRTQEAQSQKAETTKEQQEPADIQDNEAEEQLEDKSGEPADTQTEITGEQQEDPDKENEALRKQVEEALDIALDDPDANAAAAKIQAGFRGHMTRKKMKGGDKDVKHKEGKEGSSAQAEHEGD